MKRREKDAVRVAQEVWNDAEHKSLTYLRHRLTSIRNYWLYGLGSTPLKVPKYGVLFDFIRHRAYT
jgi:hypothetical protein